MVMELGDLNDHFRTVECTLMTGSWPLIPAARLCFLMSMMRSFDFMFPGTVKVTLSSAIVCCHL